jgi:tetratricopeptide (TPR) repeat protein
VGQANFNLGFFQERQGQYQEAEKSFKEVHRIYSLVYGANHPGHPAVVSACCHLGSVHKCMGQFTKALEMYENALWIKRNTEGYRTLAEAVSLSDILTDIGSVYKAQGKLKKALEQYLQALDIVCEMNSRESVAAAILLNNVGTIYINFGELDKALETLEEAIRITRHSPSSDRNDL